MSVKQKLRINYLRGEKKSCSFTLFQSSKYCSRTKSEPDSNYSFILKLSSNRILMSLMRSKLKPKDVGVSKYCLNLQCVCFKFVVVIVALFPHIFAPRYDMMLVFYCPLMCYFLSILF